MRIAVYCRVSSEDQQERGTIENQIEFAQKYCDLHQLNVVAWYKDDGVTGTLPLEDRPLGAELMADAKARKFDLLLMYKIDRLGRTARVILNAVYDLEQHGVKIRSMTEPFDTGDPSGRFLLTILAGVADIERENTLARLWHGANRAAKAGKWLGGIVPYGYLINDEGYLEINNNPLPGFDLAEPDVVRLIFRLIAEKGMSTIKASDYLNALGVPPHYQKDNRKLRRGKREVSTAGIWRPNAVGRIIKNTTYKGIHYYGKRSNKQREVIEREVPAIVPVEVWEKAQQVLKNNQIISRRNSKHQYLLRGLIKCGECGLTYHGTYFSAPAGKPKHYYICGGKTAYRGPLDGKCKSKNIPRDWIDTLVWETCVNFINNPGEAIEELRGNMEQKKSQKKSLQSELKLLNRSLEFKESEKQSILDLYRKKIIAIGDVTEQLTKIEQETAKLKERLQELEKQFQDELSYSDQFESAEELLANLREKINDPPFEIRQQVVNILVDKVVVHTEPPQPPSTRPTANVVVNYNFTKLLPTRMPMRFLR